ncbi:MAG: hypothetical protein AAFN70_18615, partial [Planctomycetota bacterium]
QRPHGIPLRSLLEDDGPRGMLRQLFPGQSPQSFLAALRQMDSSAAGAIELAGHQLQMSSVLAQYPTLAVAGMLNSGKTSLVATFLSENGRDRTLRGVGDAEGTHRFVLWLPQAWRADTSVWDLLMQRIGSAIGNSPEILSDDPQQAHQQYNNGAADADALRVPLVATDPALDTIGLGLLDCPDIVSDESFGRGTPQTRRDLLASAATLCSSFLIVTAAESFRDATLADLLRLAGDLMPGVPRMLAVNKVRAKQTPDQLHATFAGLAQRHGINDIYAAYDFDVRDCLPFIPELPEEDETRPDTRLPSPASDDPLPVFFHVSPEIDDNPPASIPAERFLITLPSRLQPSKLFDSHRQALEDNLRRTVLDQGLSV